MSKRHVDLFDFVTSHTSHDGNELTVFSKTFEPLGTLEVETDDMLGVKILIANMLAGLLRELYELPDASLQA